MLNMNINEYRENHRRCKTCIHAHNNKNMVHHGWICEAKRESHYGCVEETLLDGIFCRLYEPVKFDYGGDQDRCRRKT